MVYNVARKIETHNKQWILIFQNQKKECKIKHNNNLLRAGSNFAFKESEFSSQINKTYQCQQKNGMLNLTIHSHTIQMKITH